PHEGLRGPPGMLLGIDLVDELTHTQGDRRVGEAGQAHDQQGPAQGQPVSPGDQPPNLAASLSNQAELAGDSLESLELPPPFHTAPLDRPIHVLDNLPVAFDVPPPGISPWNPGRGSHRKTRSIRSPAGAGLGPSGRSMSPKPAALQHNTGSSPGLRPGRIRKPASFRGPQPVSPQIPKRLHTPR